MIKFAKAQFASFLASLVDYGITVFAVEFVGFWYLAGSSTGTILGGITNFSLGRNWVFKGGERERHIQLFRYFMVWSGYLFLATTGVYLLTHFANFNYLVSKASVTLFLAVAYNYPLQKRYVFR
ncbi:GtrA family protein [Flavisolibacter nicotianae]|uniref:GtrA family protein n=1 Tax=Flavisolibacter nicotianae TaxID=2364882 RepID=UPI000EAF48EC|nr:GtrA family protein [Flavisolibacter nicotianae]